MINARQSDCGFPIRQILQVKSADTAEEYDPYTPSLRLAFVVVVNVRRR